LRSTIRPDSPGPCRNCSRRSGAKSRRSTSGEHQLPGSAGREIVSRRHHLVGTTRRAYESQQMVAASRGANSRSAFRRTPGRSEISAQIDHYRAATNNSILSCPPIRSRTSGTQSRRATRSSGSVSAATSKFHLDCGNRLIGVESNRYTGYYHHRWLIDVVGEGRETEMVFRFKPHCIHESFRYDLPRRFVRGKPWA
jgi:hypothetical protein